MEDILNPAKVRKHVSEIHVCNEQEGVRIITRQPTDAEYEAKEDGPFRFSVEGDGTRFKPFQYAGSA